MSAIFHHRPFIAGHSPTQHIVIPSFGSLADIPRLWLESYRRLRASKAASAELMALDDRVLRDIGLDRSEITSALLEVNGERRACPPLQNQKF